MGLSLVTAPAIEPIVLQEAKDHLNLDHADHDAMIDAIIRVARDRVEDETGRALITQTWDQVFECFPGASRGVPRGEIELAKAPLQSVTSISYIDTAGATQTLTAVTDYKVDAITEPGRIVPAFNKTWPQTRDEINAVTIRFVCGYGAGRSHVPSGLRQAMLLIIADLYAHREDTQKNATLAPLPFGAAAFMSPYVVHTP